MKKSLYAVLVVLLSTLGLNALASMVDVQVNSVVKETSDATGGGNGATTGGGGGSRNANVKEK